MNALFDAALRLHQRGDLVEALSAFRQAVAADPQHADAWCHLGISYFSLGRAPEAEFALRRAIQAQADHAEAHKQLGLVLAHRGRWRDAEEHFLKSLHRKPCGVEAAHDPHEIEVLNHLGWVLRRQQRFDDAIEHYRRAAQLWPEIAATHNNLGAALEECGRLDEAIGSFREALRWQPDFALARSNLGVALWRQGQYDAALAESNRAVAAAPHLCEAHKNLGQVRHGLGRLNDAMASYERALSLRPDDPEAHWKRALIWLQQGDFRRGWPEFEWRLRLSPAAEDSGGPPRWDGSPLAGRTLLIEAEQGLGDTLQFVRFASLARRSGRVVLACQAALVELLSGSAVADEVVPQDASPPSADVYAPLLSLPAIWGTTLDNLPDEVPYLAADPMRVERWRRELSALPGYKIGIAWQGNPQHRLDRQRSMPLSCFEPLAHMPGVQLISLQPGTNGDAFAQLNGRFSGLDWGQRLDREAGPFTDTAAVICSLDLVVTCDSALAHLAGALGAPVWVALSAAPDWRWLLDRHDSPWYPTMRLFRQSKLDDWSDVFHRMAAKLRLCGNRLA